MNSLEENKLELPLEFLNLLEESIGSSNSEILIKRLQNESAVTSIRFNTFKNYIPENLFSDNKLEKVTWANNGFYLDQRPRFTSDPYFHAGYYYVQEASGMYMDIVKKSIEKDSNCFFTQKIISLDLCAAPGGKSTHLVSLLNDKSLLVANEVIKTRATILADNIAKWGSSNVIVSNNDPQHFTNLKEVFELIIVDAPCSGEGLFGKDSLAVKEWSLDNVKLCTQRQKRILSDVWPSLKEGGYMVYSTCTYNKYENDENLQFICDTLGAEVIDLVLPEHSGIFNTKQGGAQFIPGMIKGEGQYMAIVRKNGDDSKLFSPIKIKELKDKSKQNIAVKELKEFFNFRINSDLLKGYPIQLEKDIIFFENNLKVILSGIAIANIKGKDFIPHADFALWSNLQKLENLPFNISQINVDIDIALKFLCKEALFLPNEPKGFILIKYNNAPLGFVKNLGNRCNNLLPQARRILKL